MCKQEGDRKDPQRKGKEPGRRLPRDLCSEVGERAEESAGWTRDTRGGSDTSFQPSPGTEKQPGSDPATLFGSLHLQVLWEEGLFWNLGAAEAGGI